MYKNDCITVMANAKNKKYMKIYTDFEVCCIFFKSVWLCYPKLYIYTIPLDTCKEAKSV